MQNLAQDKILTAKYLTFAGIIPFIGLGVLSAYCADYQTDIFRINLEFALRTYSAIIATFVAGIHWGLYLIKDAPRNLFVQSNIVTLLAWLSLLLSPLLGFPLVTACFIYLISIDIRLSKAKVIEPWFMSLRLYTSIGVIATLVLYTVITVMK